MYTLSRELWNTKMMVKISVLGVIAFILMLFNMPVAFIAPPFMKFDLSDLPGLIGAFALGPIAGVIVQFLKNIMNLVFEGTTTAGVGELTNFVVGSVFVYTAGAIYFRKKTYKSALVGLILGTIAMTIVISLLNYHIMFPLYARLFGWPLRELINMGASINGNIVDLKTMMIYSVAPFNLLKGAILTVITMLLYKRISPVLHR